MKVPEGRGRVQKEGRGDATGGWVGSNGVERHDNKNCAKNQIAQSVMIAFHIYA